MNMFKKNGGFTLVELIVVIAILAILAGVAIPAYSGYINSANKAADVTALSAVKTAAMATFATKGEVTKITVTDAATDAYTVEVNSATVTFTEDNIADFNTYMSIPAGGTFSIALKTGSTAVWESTGTNAGEWVITGTPYNAGWLDKAYKSLNNDSLWWSGITGGNFTEAIYEQHLLSEKHCVMYGEVLKEGTQVCAYSNQMNTKEKLQALGKQRVGS